MSKNIAMADSWKSFVKILGCIVDRCICICICSVSNIYIYWLLTLEEQGLFLVSQFIVQLETSIMTLFGKFLLYNLLLIKNGNLFGFNF